MFTCQTRATESMKRSQKRGVLDMEIPLVLPISGAQNRIRIENDSGSCLGGQTLEELISLFGKIA